MIKNKKILITGGCGFIGTHLAERLHKNNQITLFDLTKNMAGDTGLLKYKNIKYLKGDILNKKQVFNAIKGKDIIVHMASVVQVANVYKDPYNNMKVCLDGTKNVVDACLEHKPSRMVNLSTSEVYGPYAYGVSEKIITKQGTTKDLRWTYSVGKVAGEHITRWGINQGMKGVIVRPFNIYGVGQNSNVIFQHIKNGYLNGAMYVNGNGSQVRAFCHVNDFLDGLEKCMTNKKAIGEDFNIGNPSGAITMQELASKIKYKAGLDYVKIINRVYDAEDVEIRVPCIDKAKDILKYEPKINLDLGLVEYIRWFKGMVEKHKNE